MKATCWTDNLSLLVLVLLAFATSAGTAAVPPSAVAARRLYASREAAPDLDPGQAKPLAIGLRKQLLVDDLVLAERANVTRELGQVTKANDGKPLIVAD